MTLNPKLPNFQSRLKFIIENYYFGKASLFARATGLTNEVLSRWINAKNKPTTKNLILVRKIGLNDQWLLTGEGPMWLEEKDNNEHKYIKELSSEYISNAKKVTLLEEDIYIKLVSVPANAGKSYTFDDIPEIMLPVSKRFNPRRNLAFKITGDSMSPTIPDGYIVIVDIRRNPKHNDIIVCQCFGELLCKRLEIVDGVYYLCSDNPNYKKIKLNNLNDCKIAGVVVHAEINFY